MVTNVHFLTPLLTVQCPLSKEKDYNTDYLILVPPLEMKWDSEKLQLCHYGMDYLLLNVSIWTVIYKLVFYRFVFLWRLIFKMQTNSPKFFYRLYST